MVRTLHDLANDAGCPRGFDIPASLDEGATWPSSPGS